MIAISWNLANCSCPLWSANTDESALRRSLASLDVCSSSLHWWLGLWTFLVAAGVALEIIFVVWEYIEDLHDCKRSLIRPPVRPNLLLFILGLLGAGLVTVGVAGELNVESKIATVETCIRNGNNELSLLLSKEAGDAATSAKTAHEEADAVKGIADESRADAKDALAKAKAAQGELSHAEADAARAHTAASKSLSTADKAESHLAEAVKRADILTAKLERLITPRSLPHSEQVLSPLKTFVGTEYVFIGTCADEECFHLVSDIDALLKLAGWKRVKGPPLRIGITQFIINGDKDFKVDESVSIGTGISVETPKGIESISQIPDNQQAEHIRAAIALSQMLAQNISPSENTGKPVGVDTGTSTAVRIDVGRKPL
jgi:hypothetical protein